MSDERLRTEADAAAASRRVVLVGAGAVGATAVLSACGTDAYDRYSEPAADSAESPATPESPGAPESPAADDGDDGEPEGDGLVAAAEVEVGGGVILEDEDLVVTQPAEGEFRGFSATCTHQGCTVADVSGGTINCACHGSQFAIEDGSVVTAAEGGDPSQQDPLPTRELVQDGDWINVA